MPYVVVWQMGDGKVSGQVQEREWANQLRAVEHYHKVREHHLTEWVRLVNRTVAHGERVLESWQYVVNTKIKPSVDDTELR